MPLGAHLGEALERDPAHVAVGVGEPAGQRGLDRLVALADRREHGRRRRAQLDALRVEQIDDRPAEVLAHLAQTYRRD